MTLKHGDDHLVVAHITAVRRSFSSSYWLVALALFAVLALGVIGIVAAITTGEALGAVCPGALTLSAALILYSLKPHRVSVVLSSGQVATLLVTADADAAAELERAILAKLAEVGK